MCCMRDAVVSMRFQYVFKRSGSRFRFDSQSSCLVCLFLFVLLLYLFFLPFSPFLLLFPARHYSCLCECSRVVISVVVYGAPPLDQAKR